jgi:hypothetical protein
MNDPINAIDKLADVHLQNKNTVATFQVQPTYEVEEKKKHNMSAYSGFHMHWAQQRNSC